MRSSIKVIGSGSTGNCLAIYDSTGAFILVDLGLPIKTILNGIDYDLKNCKCAIVTHAHKDHSRSIKDIAKMGIPVYANEETCAVYKEATPFNSALVGNFDGFKIQTFGIDHNAPNNAFIIDTPDNIRVLYITDARYVPLIVRNVHYAVIECNYSDEDIMYHEMEGEKTRSQYENHLSLVQCLDYLQAIKSDKLKGVLLWHLSRTNISPEYALRTITEELHFDNVFVAKPNIQIMLKK